MFVITSSFK